MRLFSSPLWLPRVVILGLIQIVALPGTGRLGMETVVLGEVIQRDSELPPTESILRGCRAQLRNDNGAGVSVSVWGRNAGGKETDLLV